MVADINTYLETPQPLHYDLDKDISVEMVTEGNSVYVSIYNDRTDKSIALQTNKYKLKGLADFIYKSLENK